MAGKVILYARTTASSSRTMSGFRSTWALKAASEKQNCQLRQPVKTVMTDPNSTLSHLDLETPEKPFLDANELVINMGPQHPATHGVLRVILRLDGEKVLGLERMRLILAPSRRCSIPFAIAKRF